jgi:hypothetical protein
MALSATLTKTNNFGQQTTLPNSYIKIISAHVTKNEIQAQANVFIEKEGKNLFAELYVFPHDIEGPNPIKQAYLHLKTLPEFADAVDC